MDLRVWQEAMNLAEISYKPTRLFPKEEVYGLASQVRRAAASVPANIAEGYGRENKGSYVQHLKIAQGSLRELQTHLLLAERVEIAQKGLNGPALQQCEVVARMLNGLIRSLQRFETNN
jgi:four helix bundle protein